MIISVATNAHYICLWLKTKNEVTIYRGDPPEIGVFRLYSIYAVWSIFFKKSRAPKTVICGLFAR